jgi:hypothetical protein
MANVVVVGDLAQALTFLHHAHGLAFLVRSQLRLRPEFDTSFLAAALPPLARARIRARSSSARADKNS